MHTQAYLVVLGDGTDLCVATPLSIIHMAGRRSDESGVDPVDLYTLGHARHQGVQTCFAVRVRKAQEFHHQYPPAHNVRCASRGALKPTPYQ